MKNLKQGIILFIFLIIFTLISCVEKVENKKGYEIYGNIENTPENTMVYFQYNDVIDSTIIHENKFKFKGIVKETSRASIYLKKVRKKIRFWLENSQINISANNNLTSATILGGKAQEMANLHTSKKAIYRNKLDSIGNIFDVKGKELTTDDENSLRLKLREFGKAYKNISKRFIKENPSCYESVFTLNANKPLWDKELIKSLFSPMSKEIKNTEYGKSVARYLELSKKPNIGEKYVDFNQQNTHGENVKFSELKGKYTLIEFWASWCAPCRESNPELKEIYKEYNNEGFEIVGVSLDENRENWIKAIRKDELPWSNITDLLFFENEAVIIYNVIGIPDNLLIDDEGIIVARKITSENLKTKLETIF